MDTNTYSNEIDTIVPIKQIVFCALSNETVKKISALGEDSNGVDVIELYDNSEARRGSLNDARGGSVALDSMCATCGLTRDCPGHSIHIELGEYVFHTGYEDYVQKFLSNICIGCSRVMCKDDDNIREVLRRHPHERLNFLKNMKMPAFCQRCGMQRTKIRLGKSDTTSYLIAEMEIKADDDVEGNQNIENQNSDFVKSKAKLILTPGMISEIFKKVSKEDCFVLGLDPEKTRPEDLLIKNLYVPPKQVRPSIKGDFGNGMGSEDDLTRKLNDIVRNNIKLIKNKENEGSGGSKYHSDYAHLLQIHVTSYIDNENTSTNFFDFKGRNTKSIVSRLKGKHGRFRNNLMAKRGNFTARTVITPDPSIRYNQLRVPILIVTNLTFPEVVGPDNIEEMTRLVKNGRNNYPGANYVFPLGKASPDKRVLRIDLRYRKDNITLNYGDVVERHLRDNDVVLLNRQPTLHKQSMMAFKIKVVNNYDLMTFGMSVDCTKSYNADFDGDEMNIFVPQSIQSLIELEEIACSERQIINPSTSKTANGTIQDGLIGVFNLTHPHMKVNWRTAMNLITYTSVDGVGKIKKGEDIEGSKLYSMIIPSKININAGPTVINNGNIEKGRISGAFLAAAEKSSITKNVWDEYGVEQTGNFSDNTRWMMNNFNLWNGFSVGYGDIEKPAEIIAQIDSLFENTKLKINYLVTEIENNPDLMSKKILEHEIFTILKEINENSNKLVGSNISEFNGFGIMALSGAKGKDDYTGQIMGSIGMQTFENGIIPKKYNGRTLAYYHQNDDSGESRGLVRPSFSDGLEFPGLVYQTGVGRSGLMDSALKTASTGYMQRKLVKSFEDIMITYDGKVRNANGYIIQYVYGDSGANTISQFEYDIDFLEMTNDMIAENCVLSDEELKQTKDYTKKENEKLFEEYKKMRNNVIKCSRKAKLNYISKIKTFMTPINFTRIINNYKNKKSSNKNITPKYIIEKIEELLTNNMTPLIPMNKKEKENLKSYKNIDEQIHKTILRCCLYNCVCPKKVIFEYGWDKEMFDTVIAEFSGEFEKNIIEPGEMVGVITGCAAGEPLTQMNLNSFHLAGVSRTNSNNMGVPRIVEIFSVSKNPKAPEMTIYFEDNIRTNKEITTKIKSNLKNIVIGEVRNRINVYYDPNPSFEHGITKEDNIIPFAFNKNPGKIGCQNDISSLPFLIRMEMNSEKMAEKEVKLIDIISQFCSWWERRYIEAKNVKKEERRIMSKITNLSVLSNRDNDAEQIIHIRFNAIDAEKDKFDLETINDFIEQVLDKFKLKGIEGINDIGNFLDDKTIIFDEKTGESKTEKEYIIVTSGVNMHEIRYINGINLNKTLTNDIVTMYNTFGIEMARSLLFTEIMDAYDVTGKKINSQHVQIIVDQMTMTGALNSIDRHGFNRSDTDPLSRASFEKPVEQLWKAAVFGEVDNMNGVSSRIMAGLCIKGGTGYSELILNTEMLEKSGFEEKSQLGRKNYQEIKTNNIVSDIVNNTNIAEDDGVFMPV